MAKKLSSIGGSLVSVVGTLGRADTGADCCCGKTFEPCSEHDCELCATSYTIEFNQDSAALPDPDCPAFDYKSLLNLCFAEMGPIVLTGIGGCHYSAQNPGEEMNKVIQTIQDYRGQFVGCVDAIAALNRFEYSFNILCHPGLGLVLNMQIHFISTIVGDDDDGDIEEVYRRISYVVDTFFLQSPETTCPATDWIGDATETVGAIFYTKLPFGGANDLTTDPTEMGTWSIT